ncbi:MAG: response regulator [Deltaproteobacteria bacterium]|nr:response regulator [Deltaproteobacteria bacterium]
MRCLVVEDEDFGRELVKCLLMDYAESIDTANNGAEAVEQFERALHEGRPYQLVCLDIMMPIMDGQEALKRMRQLEKGAVPPAGKPAVIIMTTALDSLQEIQEAIWQGDCDDYLVKPISQADLVALLHKFKLTDRVA